MQWLYCLSILRKKKNLRIIDASKLKNNNYNSIITNFDSLLLQNIDPNPENRLTILQTIHTFNGFLYKRNIIVVFRNGSAIGDHVYMTGVLREIAQKKIKIVLFSNFYELFENNHRICITFLVYLKCFCALILVM